VQPRLSALIDSKIGNGWTRDLDQLRKLEQWADDPQFQADFMAAKRANKEDLAKVIRHLCDVEVSPDALFDVQVKRLHEYKRQHLNLLHILALYRRLLQNPKLDIAPRVFVFGAKAAPGYDLAKNIIKAANSMAKMINADERIGGKLKIASCPTTACRLPRRSSPPPLFPSRSPPPARRPRARAT
jgi:starch phosphorylase